MKPMEKDIIKICLTGGPCAGKTTSLSKIIETFTPQFAVYTVPEMATMTFSSGVTIVPSSFTEQDSRKFTTSIIQAQIDIEKYFENLTLTQRKKVIMITDRGCCDNFAYTTPANKAKILDEEGWTMNYLCNERYDMVIHLVTAASGAEEFYTMENNAARSEGKQEAIELDKRIQQQWMSHPNFVIIDNSKKGFEKKINRVLDVVGQVAGLKMTPKIVRKYLIDPKFNISQIPENVKYEQYTEVQTFLMTNKPKTQNFVIKRMHKDHNMPIYIYGSRTIEEKYEKRIETHKIISEKMYLTALSSQRDNKFDQTKREIYRFSADVGFAFNIYTIEKVSSRGHTYMVLKITRDEEYGDQEIVPKWLKVYDDITEMPKFFSMNFSNIDYEDKSEHSRKISVDFDMEHKLESEVADK